MLKQKCHKLKSTHFFFHMTFWYEFTDAYVTQSCSPGVATLDAAALP